MSSGKRGASAERHRVIEDLRELVRALDRRVPRLDHTGEGLIARDAAHLRNRALERIARLETCET